jgi:hypothetical protein
MVSEQYTAFSNTAFQNNFFLDTLNEKSPPEIREDFFYNRINQPYMINIASPYE